MRIFPLPGGETYGVVAQVVAARTQFRGFRGSAHRLLEAEVGALVVGAAVDGAAVQEYCQLPLSHSCSNTSVDEMVGEAAAVSTPL